MREPNILQVKVFATISKTHSFFTTRRLKASAVNVTECNEVTLVDGNFGSLPVED